MNKVILVSAAFTVLAIGGIVALLKTNNAEMPTGSVSSQANVTMIDGKQVIQIHAKGGYAPRVTVAKANTPTVIDVITDGTYDCSSSLTVAAVGFRKTLPSTGTTPIDIPPQKPGAIIKGLCTMGMYSFVVNFN